MFKQNVVVKGQLLRAYHNAKINNNLTVDNKLTVQGVTKLQGIVKMLGINQINQQALQNGNFTILLKQQNGNVVEVPPALFGFEYYEPPVSDYSPCQDYNSLINQAASWIYYPSQGKVLSCKKVGISRMPHFDLDVLGYTRTHFLKAGFIFAGNQMNGDNPITSVTSNVSIYSTPGPKKIEIGEIMTAGKKVFFEVDDKGTVTIQPKYNNNPLIIKNENGQKIVQVENSGLLRAREVKVDLDYANWPDYVFEKDYNIFTLEQVAKYILKHKHLPGVPSAQQIKTEGLSLGKMQTIIMQKVEELTLYTIEQNTQIKHLEKNVSKLEKENQQLKADLQQMNEHLDKIEALLNAK